VFKDEDKNSGMKPINLLGAHAIALGVLLACLILTSLAHASDIRFAAGKKALAIPFELDANVIFLRVGVNGTPPPLSSWTLALTPSSIRGMPTRSG